MKHALWFLVVVCALSVGAAPRAAAAGQEPRTRSEARLVTRQGGKIVDVPLEHTEVAIRIDGMLAQATVTQRFRSPYKARIEAAYLFPLPAGAAASGLTIVSGDRTIRGAIQERGKAAQIYVATREQGLAAALLTQERSNLFTQVVARLEPAATIEVTLTYVQRLPYADGGYELVVPMVAGSPGPRSSQSLGLRVELDAGVPIEGLESPSHPIAIERPAGATALATVKLRPSDAIPNQDFVLRYRVAGAAPRFGVLAHRAGSTGSFLLLAQPPAAPPAAQLAPREIVIALDTSSSMRGLPLAKAKDVVRKILRGLGPDDTFQIVRFSDRWSPLGPAPIASKPKNVELVLDWLAAQAAGGGAETAVGIDAALAVPHDPARLRIVVLVTDGYVGDEGELLRQVALRMRDARLFAFGVGTAVNRYLLEELAALGRGAAQFVRPDESSAAAVDAFERRIARPILTDLRIDWGGLAVADVSPRALPDLFAGQPLVLAGHYTAPGAGVITVRGKQAGRDVSFQVLVQLPSVDTARPAVAALWARQRIAELSRQLGRAADPARAKEVLALSLEHQVLTPYTAFVAVEETRAAGGGAPKQVVVPVEVPAKLGGIAEGRWEMVSDNFARYVYSPGSGGSGGGFGLSAGFGSSGSGSSSYGSIGIGRYGIGGGTGTGRASAYEPPAPLVSDVVSRDVVAEINASRARSPMVRGGRVRYAELVVPAPTVLGDGLDKEIVRRYVRRKQPQLQRCYEQELAASPKLGGTVTARIAISESGNVTASTASGVGNATVESCIAELLKSIEFPRPEDGLVIATFALQLNPPSEGP
ncbi:MAG TPA: VIT domain-containing protein [Kofleriaceae bacterium]|nr:VIT domain-containing protein [Kofleriaceae bacterium]